MVADGGQAGEFERLGLIRWDVSASDWDLDIQNAELAISETFIDAHSPIDTTTRPAHVQLFCVARGYGELQT